MRFRRFHIENFKGIVSATVDFGDDGASNVTTLVGLNESGKTTILEAISHFITHDTGASALTKSFYERNYQDLVPKSKEAAFTDKISVSASVELEMGDIDVLSNHLKAEYGLELDTSSIPQRIPIENRLNYEDSIFKSQRQYWSLIFEAKAPNGELNRYTGFENESDAQKAIWLSAVAELRNLIPLIVYFPTFLFDFPDRIYLEYSKDYEGYEINEYYKLVLQDVLDALGENISIERHILERIKQARKEHVNPATFMSHFVRTRHEKHVSVVCQRISSEMTEVIFGAWSKVLGRSMKDKRVEVKWNLDAEEENAVFLEMSIIDGASIFSLSERSLGFRWFFSFLLFTRFRESRKSGPATVFMFDEPASNLHPKAQLRLLESFRRIASNRIKIIYSTHSHYLINPLWLENAYIIQNKSLDHDSEDKEQEYNTRNADIVAIKYKTFVGSYPNKSSYFQPILDALQVPVTNLERSSRAIIVEGKNDFSRSTICLDPTFATTLTYFPAQVPDQSAPLFRFLSAGESTL